MTPEKLRERRREREAEKHKPRPGQIIIYSQPRKGQTLDLGSYAGTYGGYSQEVAQQTIWARLKRWLGENDS